MPTDKKYHFIGIGGIGMSALAQILYSGGAVVQGSELVNSKTVALLKKQGIPVFLGHDQSHVAGADCVVWSSAIAQDHAEMVAARAAGIETVHRAQLLARISHREVSQLRAVAVTGTHGKTTTTNMIFHVLRASGADPTLISGGIDVGIGSNAHAGKDPVMVLEADESDGSLTLFYPHSAVLTNLEEEHMGFYKDLSQIQSVFHEFVAHLRAPGCTVFCADDRNLNALMQEVSGPRVSYGLGSGADFFASNVRRLSQGSAFDVRERGKTLGTVVLNVPGMHNVTNALGAVALGRQWGLEFEAIRKGLQGFRGTMRRLEWKAEVHGVRVLDDYAHHPTEIRASLEALAGHKRGRLVVVFQPHRYSRVHYLQSDFARCFALADEVILTPIFSAGETNIHGVTSEGLAQQIRQTGYAPVSVAAQDFEGIAAGLASRVRAGDTVVGMGAGDIEQFSPLMKAALSALAVQSGEALRC